MGWRCGFVCGVTTLVLMLLLRAGHSGPAEVRVAPTSFPAAAEMFAQKSERMQAAPSVLLVDMLTQLSDIPAIHSRGYANRSDDPEEKVRLLGDVESAETLLGGVAFLAKPLEKASDKEFELALSLLLQLRERIMKPGAYGNFVCGMGLSHYIGSMGLERVFANPKSANQLYAMLSDNCNKWLVSWPVLKASLSEETRGEIRLEQTSEASLQIRLLEVLQHPLDFTPKPDLELAERSGAFIASVEALGKKRNLIGKEPSVVPLLDSVQTVRLVAILSMTESMTVGSVWWTAFLERHPTLPRNYGEFEDFCVSEKESHPPPINPLTDERFKTDELFLYLMRHGDLARKASAFLLLRSQPTGSMSPSN